MSSHPISLAFINIDKFCDIVPLLSTVSNSVDIALKIILSVVSLKIEITNHYFKYIHKKSLFKCCTLLVPFAGQVIMLVIVLRARYFYSQAVKKEQTEPERAFKLYQQAANSGNIAATYKVGKCYQNGIGTQTDLNKALQYFQEAADEDHPDAIHDLAACHLDGQGVSQNTSLGAKLLRRASGLGHSQSMYRLALCYQNGQGVPAQPDQSIQYLQNTLNINPSHADAIFMLGRSHLEGWGVPKNLKKAVGYFKKVAELGHVQGKFFLGYCYLYGLGITKDVTQAIHIFQSILQEHPHHPDTLAQLGICYLHGWGIQQDDNKALDAFKDAAQQGHKEGKFQLACCYMKMPENRSKAFHLFSEVLHVDPNNGEVNYQLGLCYYYGWGVAADLTKAFSLLRKAAALQNENASLFLARYYLFVQAGTQDKGEGFRHCQEVLQQNSHHPEALFMLGRCKAEGWGTEPNNLEAYDYYRRAAALDHLEARYFYALFLLSHDDRTKAISQLQAIIAKDNLHAEAFNLLGACYINDPAEVVNGFRCLERAAQLGSASGCLNLSACYRNGTGVQIDLAKASFYEQKSVELASIIYPTI